MPKHLHQQVPTRAATSRSGHQLATSQPASSANPAKKTAHLTRRASKHGQRSEEAVALLYQQRAG